MTRIRATQAAMRVLGEGLSKRGRGHEDCEAAYRFASNPRPERRGNHRMIEAPPAIAARFGLSISEVV